MPHGFFNRHGRPEHTEAQAKKRSSRSRRRSSTGSRGAADGTSSTVWRLPAIVKERAAVPVVRGVTHERARVLLVAGSNVEFDAAKYIMDPFAGLPHLLDTAHGLFGQVGPHPTVLLRSRNSAEDVHAAASWWHCGVVIALGMCVGLSDAVRVGDVVISSSARALHHSRLDSLRGSIRTLTRQGSRSRLRSRSRTRAHKSHNTSLAHDESVLAVGAGERMLRMFNPFSSPAIKAWGEKFRMGDARSVQAVTGEMLTGHATESLVADAATHFPEAVAAEAFVSGLPKGAEEAPIHEWVIVKGVASMREVDTISSAAMTFACTAAASLVSAVLSAVPVDDMPTSLSDEKVFSLPPRNPLFHGRDDLLGELRTRLHKHQVLRPLACVGAGGVGKSSLALEFAYRQRAHLHVVWWVRAEKLSHLESDIVELALRLGAVPHDRHVQTQKAVAALKTALAGRTHWLIVFDNVTHPKDILPYLPVPRADQHQHVLATTRIEGCSDWAERLVVKTFDEESAARMLKQQAVMPGADDVSEAVKLLGYLPLAIRQAAPTIRRKNWTAAQFVAEYKKRKTEVVKKFHPKDELLPIWVTYVMSIDKSPRLAYKLLNVCAHLASDRIPLYVLRRFDDHHELEIDEAVDYLRHTNLLTADAHDSVSMHRTLQQTVRDSLANDDARRTEAVATAVLLVDVALTQFKYPIPSTWHIARELVAHALTAAHYAIPQLIERHATIWLLDVAGTFYVEVAGQYNESIALKKRVVELTGVVYGEVDDHFGIALNNLAAAYWKAGRSKEALPLAKEAVEIASKTHSERSEPYAARLTLLGLIETELENFGEAERILEEARLISELVVGHHHIDYASRLNNLASLYYKTRQFERAMKLYRQALDIEAAVLGKESPSCALLLNNIALCYLGLREYQKALPILQRVMKIDEATVGRQHPDVARHLNNIAEVHRKMRNFSTAIPLYEEAMSISEAAMGKEDEWINFASNLAECYIDMGDADKALPLLQECVVLEERLNGKHDARYATALCNLAACYYASKAYDRAAPLFAQAVAIDAKTIPKRAPSHVVRLSNAALSFMHLGDFSKALPHAREAKDLAAVVWGTHDADYADTLYNLATCLSQLGQYQQALVEIHAAIEVFLGKLGSSHANTKAAQALADRIRAAKQRKDESDAAKKNKK